LDNCAEAGLTVTLVAAIEKGLNEHEVGDIVRFGIEHPAGRTPRAAPSGSRVERPPTAPQARNKNGRKFSSFLPAISKQALTKISAQGGPGGCTTAPGTPSPTSHDA
jgi:uncharacterized radical SAM superfamily Fe-S cluster-containing enzyme